jgi:hypothetical protein
MKLAFFKRSGYLGEGIMIQKYIPRMMVAILVTLIVLSTINASAASNSVPASHLMQQSNVLTINNKKPAKCTMNLTAIVVCTGGNCFGAVGNINELILGTPDNDTIKGNGGSDCILGGGGVDDIQGNAGGDVCFGGPEIDIFKKCETIPDKEPGE